ncbi:MAG: hypothetical protein JJT82_01280 [Legionellaceae bacterium]|nr:hypothetical protein [Legionellaceae bacterium]
MHIINGLHCREVPWDELSASDRTTMFKQLIAFARQHYHIPDAAAFVEQVLQPKRPGRLAIFSRGDQWLGFTRLYSLTLVTSEGELTVFSGSTWHDQAIKLTPYAARFALMHTLRYKLFQPQARLSYLATANTPQRYSALYQLSAHCEPQHDGRMSDSTLEIMNQMALAMDWEQDAQRPYIIKQAFRVRQYAQQASDDDPAYTALNPDYQHGDWLIVYLPLDLQMIGKCLKQSIYEVAA